MKVKMKTSIGMARQSLQYGQIVDLPDAMAQRLIEKGAAEAVADAGELSSDAIKNVVGHIETQVRSPGEIRAEDAAALEQLQKSEDPAKQEGENGGNVEQD